METPKPTKYLRLPFQFDEAQLVKDLDNISKSDWIPHHYKMSYDGEWTSISLFSPEGDARNVFAFSDARNIQPTSLLKQCPYFSYVISQLKCPLISVRLLKLSPGSIIKPHQDYQLGYEDNNFRLHIPITTHEKIDFVLDGEKLVMAPGECWYTNVNYTHSVANRGDKSRVHLVIDGERNDWSDDLFFSLAPRESFLLKEAMEKENLRQAIKELERQADPVHKDLIETLKNTVAGKG